jgi:hypothetical protein
MLRLALLFVSVATRWCDRGAIGRSGKKAQDKWPRTHGPEQEKFRRFPTQKKHLPTVFAVPLISLPKALPLREPLAWKDYFLGCTLVKSRVQELNLPEANYEFAA